MKNLIIISLLDSALTAGLIENRVNSILLCAATGVLLYGLLYRFFVRASVARVNASAAYGGEKPDGPVMMCTAEQTTEEIFGISLPKVYRRSNAGKPVAALVESDAEFRVCLETCLSADYVIKSFESGAEVWAYMEKECPDVVIGNILLRGMSGAELSRKLKNDMKTSSVPVILYAFPDEAVLRHDRQFSLADAFLLPPFSVDDLKVEMEVLIRNAGIVRRSLVREILGERFSEAASVAGISRDDCNLFNRVKDYILENMDNENLKIDDIASCVSMSRTSFYLRWKALTGEAPSCFLTTLRMEKARELLESGKYLVADIPVMVGIRDDKHFRTTYKRHFKRTPSQSIRKE